MPLVFAIGKRRGEWQSQVIDGAGKLVGSLASAKKASCDRLPGENPSQEEEAARLELMKRAQSETTMLFRADIDNPESSVAISDSHFYYNTIKLWFGDIAYIKKVDREVSGHAYSAILFKCLDQRTACNGLGNAGGYVGNENGIHLFDARDKRDQIYSELAAALGAWSEKYQGLPKPTIY
jgi:hypothetical protein